MSDLRDIISGFKGKRIVVVGDVMLDQFIDGKVERISPEAPVPVVKVSSEKCVPGGAANVAVNISALEGKVSLFGFRGNDWAGQKLSSLVRQSGINFYPTISGTTTRKVRISPQNHNLMRLDYEEDAPRRLYRPELMSEVDNCDIVVVSDYAKGVASKELMDKLIGCGKRVVVDPKPRNFSFYKGVFLVKSNEKEALEISGVEDGNVHEAGRNIREKAGSNVLVTRGSKGMLLFGINNGNGVREFPSLAKEVYDVTGAGDSVISALALSLASGASLEDAVILSNHAAGIVIGKRGTASLSRRELEREIFKDEEKIKTREELGEIIKNYQGRGRKVVWTNGCFDILHEGHIRYLRKASGLGDLLVVGLNSDDSIRRLKGSDRPIRSQEARSEVLAGLGCVDYVTIFDEDSATRALDKLRPDIYVKADDYNLGTMNQEERRVIEGYMGRIIFIPIEVKVSTSGIVKKIRG